jgi:hypothetical protein
MGIRQVVWGNLFVLVFSAAMATFADTISGSGSATFQSWAVTNLNQNGSPYWDNPSMDGDQRNVGYFLTDAPSAPLSGAPGALPFWGNAYNSVGDNGGTADLSFFFQRSAPTSSALLKLEVAGQSNVNEFGWYDITNPSALHPLFLGPDSAPANDIFSPSLQYGFYLKSGSTGTFYTQSSLNTSGDTSHQHFAVFQESAVTGAEIYWIGIEDLTVGALNGNEGSVGDYNDMLIRLSPLSSTNEVPEPSTALLVLSSALLLAGLRLRRRT